MKKSLCWLVVIGFLLSACAAPVSPVAADASMRVGEAATLTVFAAASLTDAFGEMGEAFEAAHPGVTVRLNFAGSHALRTQIEQGAAADVFASANMKEMEALAAGNFVTAENVQVFLSNQLVVILPVSNPGGLKVLADLGKEGVKLVLAAREVPVGDYSLQALEKLDAALGAGFKDKVLGNVVSYENDVKQVVAKVALGEADAGIVYLSDTVAAPELVKIEIPAENNVVAKYPLAALKEAKNPELAEAFIGYVISAEGQGVLNKWGFFPVK